ncbi:hypothetical protein ACFWY6_15545, partial [Streptomyces sp. NPDC059037]
MTAQLHFADAGEAADLAAFLARLIHYDKAAAVRLQAAGETLAVFGRPPSWGGGGSEWWCGEEHTLEQQVHHLAR